MGTGNLQWVSVPARSGGVRSIPVDGGDAWHVLLVADDVGQQSIAYLPCKHRRVLSLILANRLDHPRRRHLGLAAADHARLDRARLVIPTEHTQTTDRCAAGPRRRSPIHRADAGHRVLVAHSVRQQALANFPREHRHVFGLVSDDGVDDFARGHLRFAASNNPRLD